MVKVIISILCTYLCEHVHVRCMHVGVVWIEIGVQYSYPCLSRAVNKISKLIIICTNKFLCYRGSECNLYSFDQARPNGVVEICGERWSWSWYAESWTWVQQTIWPGSRDTADCRKDDGKWLMLYYQFSLPAIISMCVVCCLCFIGTFSYCSICLPI